MEDHKQSALGQIHGVRYINREGGGGGGGDWMVVVGVCVCGGGGGEGIYSDLGRDSCSNITDPCVLKPR